MESNYSEDSMFVRFLFFDIVEVRFLVDGFDSENGGFS